MRNKLSLLTLGASCVLLFFSCKKGDTGPQGEPGAQGQQGSQGQQGPKGDTGVANVIYSDWLDVAYEAVVDETTGDTTGYQAAIEAPKLTKDILDKGEIKVYLNFNTPDDPAVFPLPYNDGNAIINPIYVEGGILLVSNADASTGLDGDGAKVFQHRYVLIPGGVLAKKPNNINLENYAEAKKYLKLKD